MPGRENKPHIGIYGRCNTGKSTLLNFITEAPTAVVSPRGGTTTDPVRKSYEITGYAPVVLIDTAGTDDRSPLGSLRTAATYATIAQVDLALLLWRTWGEPERELARRFRAAGVPFLPVFNAEAGGKPCRRETDAAAAAAGREVVTVCALGGGAVQRDRLLDAVKRALPESSFLTPSLFGDRIGANDVVLLVCPIDSGAPAGRLILPQVQTIRDLLDRRALAVVVQPQQVAAFFESGVRPKLVVTDSQAFCEVRTAVPSGIEVTSFSILLAAAKGDYATYAAGLAKADRLREGDRILVVENCSHQSTCEDIGRVKIPVWLQEHAGVNLRFEFVSGLAPLPEDLARYALMVQCGGCMATRNQLLRRIRAASSVGLAVTNYGMLIRKIRTSADCR